ncbi:LOW QUALITY PROTEIN: WD40-repeat-containing domain protein [Linnemannia elongata]|nr:LOW QUALITY PROTEIN: WD40-repeat-containing domain protein [Linnemannia elongata]
MAFLNDLVLHCTTPQLAHLTNIIAPRLKRDFLRDLPLELAHHILSMIDEPKSLVRVSLVSKFWHQLVETEDWIWRAQCIRQFGPTSCSSLPSPRAHLLKMATSYKAYFKRRFMIDRNWISGHHSLISYTTPETGVVTSLQFDHHHIVVGCDNSRIQIFETTSGRLIRTLQGHLGGVWALEFVKGVGSTGEKMLVSGGCDRELRVWDMNTGKCRLVMPGHTGTIRCLKLHQLPDGDDGAPPRIKRRTQHQYHPQRPYLAITGSRDATLRVWDLQTGENKFGHRDSVRCIEAHGDRLVSGSYDCTARVWSLITGECLLILQGHFQQIYSIAFNGEYIITGSLDSTCRLWSPVTGACLATLQGHTQLLQLSGDSLMTDGFMYLWNLRTFECQYRVQAHDHLCFDPKRIVTGGNDGAVKLWDRQTGKFIRLLTKTDAAIWRVAICEERVVICMQKNGRTAMEVIGGGRG